MAEHTTPRRLFLFLFLASKSFRYAHAQVQLLRLFSYSYTRDSHALLTSMRVWLHNLLVVINFRSHGWCVY